MFRRFSIFKIVKESSTIKSFYFKRTSNEPLEVFQPGQFITLRIKSSSLEQPILRNYTLSDAPGNNYFRITVKRENQGIVSKYLHDQIKKGDTIEVSKPLGDFSLTTQNEKPVVLLSGGVGITPMMSMLEYIIEKQKNRKVFFLHSSHDKTVQPMLDRLREINATHNNVFLSIFHSNPNSDEQQFLDYDVKGKISKDYLSKTLPRLEMDYYLCGPVPFMEIMFQSLTELQVNQKNINYEFFGGAKKLGLQPVFVDSNSSKFKVKFKKSKKEIIWQDKQGSILDLAESVGLTPEFSCRMGTCSTCESTLLNGNVEYDPEPFMEIPEGRVLICCSKPKSNIEIEL